MNSRGIFFIIIVSLAFAGSSVFMKLGMNRIGKFDVSLSGAVPFLLKVIVSPQVLLGMILGIVGTLFYLDLLSKYALNLVYPSLSLVYILVALAGIFFLGERITFANWAGILLICAGVGFISIKG
jgi:drug/metabolite transporter (DMT)-like permease